ncbi:hypothetical protein HPP92_017266 [Vanilla planifolia]|uniref:Uncharacterized protein n=1 Tax=Vanilla planifolia TaxID=51239 RepID=A0A835QAT8_VANPL|nr:hypothetical protein HPP92_017266 [Vanilla planifolia]
MDGLLSFCCWFPSRISPERLLWDKFIVLTELNCEMLRATSPDTLFMEVQWFQEQHVADLLWDFQTNLFLDKLNLCIELRLLMLSGIGPKKKLFDRSKIQRQRSCSSSDGILPENIFDCSRRCTSNLRFSPAYPSITPENML